MWEPKVFPPEKIIIKVHLEMVYLDTAYFTETKKLLLKIL